MDGLTSTTATRTRSQRLCEQHFQHSLEQSHKSRNRHGRPVSATATVPATKDQLRLRRRRPLNWLRHAQLGRIRIRPFLSTANKQNQRHRDRRWEWRRKSRRLQRRRHPRLSRLPERPTAFRFAGWAVGRRGEAGAVVRRGQWTCLSLLT